MPQEDESVALSSIATLPDGTKMSLADYFLGKRPGVSPAEKKADAAADKEIKEDATRTGAKLE